ncbi:MAG: hypothetical protein PHF13_04300 [Acholeplasmataceae bacterium]|nr:hypothetical protein [Acholeplasmataceae bacterium]
MTSIRVTLSALNSTKEAINVYSRDMADAIANFNNSNNICGKWCDEHYDDFMKSSQLLVQTVSSLANSSDTLAKRIEKKAELVAENKTYRVD